MWGPVKSEVKMTALCRVCDIMVSGSDHDMDALEGRLDEFPTTTDLRELSRNPAGLILSGTGWRKMMIQQNSRTVCSHEKARGVQELN